MKYIYVQMCVNLKSGEILKRESEISTDEIVSNGCTPDLNGLLKLINRWNQWAVSSVHPELRWFFCTYEN